MSQKAQQCSENSGRQNGLTTNRCGSGLGFWLWNHRSARSSIYAVIALQEGRGAKYASGTIDALAASVPYELGLSYFTLYPAYVRGEAYLAAHQGPAAVAEFEKIRPDTGSCSSTTESLIR
jgi:hypothetical protein